MSRRGGRFGRSRDRSAGFTAHKVKVGRLARSAGCDGELWITGWHEDDTRYIAHRADPPALVLRW